MSVKRVIRLGDKTTHGGEVVSAASDYSIMDKAVAREHDIVTCPIKGHGSGGIIGGDRMTRIGRYMIVRSRLRGSAEPIAGRA